MKNVTWLLLLIFLIEHTSGNDGLLSKFHQNGYKIKDTRTEVISYDKNYLEIFKAVTFKYNRTTTAHNGTARFKKDLYDKAEVIVQGYKFLSNEYRPLAIRYQINVNKACLANVIGMKQITNCGNLTNCIFNKDITYFACNFVLDETYLPPLIPNGRYKVRLHYLYLNQEIAVVDAFGEVYTPIYISK